MFTLRLYCERHSGDRDEVNIHFLQNLYDFSSNLHFLRGCFIYVSNRGHDSITAFRVNLDADLVGTAAKTASDDTSQVSQILLDESSGNGQPLVPVGHFATGGRIPRRSVSVGQLYYTIYVWYLGIYILQ